MKVRTIKRDNLYAGYLVKKISPSIIVSEDECDKLEYDLSFDEYICRGMLFTIDDNKHAKDEMYDGVINYPIKGITPEDQFLVKNLYIDGAINLSDILIYLNYGKALKKRDIIQIYKRFIDPAGWISKNLNLFGMKKKGDIIYLDSKPILSSDELFNTLYDLHEIKNGLPNNLEIGYSLVKRKK